MFPADGGVYTTRKTFLELLPSSTSCTSPTQTGRHLSTDSTTTRVATNNREFENMS